MMTIGQQPRRRARGAMSCAILVLTSLLTTSCRGKAEPETTPVVTVDVAPVLLSKIQRTIRAEGLLYPRQQAAIIPKITSPIRAQHVQKGAKVKAGQLLIELESRDLAGAAAETRAALNQAEATFQTTSRATVPQDTQRAELEMRAAKDALDAAQSVFDSRQALVREGAIAQKDVNDAQSAVSQARTQYETARKRLEDLQSFGRVQALEAAKAQRDVARGHDEAVQAQLGYARITSPIAGVITDLPFYPGETPPSGAAVVTVMDVSQVIARAHVSPAEAAELHTGSDANIIGQGGAPIAAKVTQISPAVDAASTTVEVWVQAENPEGALRPGSTVRVEMIAKTIDNTLLIPARAILTSSSGGTFAIVIDGENTPHLRKVAVGIRDSGKAQVTDGLESGQRVATTGAFELFKLAPEVFAKTKVQIAPVKEEEGPEEN